MSTTVIDTILTYFSIYDMDGDGYISNGELFTVGFAFLISIRYELYKLYVAGNVQPGSTLTYSNVHCIMYMYRYSRYCEGSYCRFCRY